MPVTGSTSAIVAPAIGAEAPFDPSKTMLLVPVKTVAGDVESGVIPVAPIVPTLTYVCPVVTALETSAPIEIVSGTEG